VSRFRRELVYASIELDRAALVRVTAEGAAKEHALVPLALDPEQPQASLGALGAVLATPAWRGAPRIVVLSDRLVRYLVLDRPEGIRSAAELRLACEARFHAAFDRPAADWRIIIDARPLARHFLACGMRTRLHDAITQCSSADGPLVALRPYLVSELRRRAQRLNPPCWFVAAAHDCIALAGLNGEDCNVIRVMATQGPATTFDIEQALARESLLAGDMPDGAPVAVSGSVSGDFTATPLRRLDAPTWGTHTAAWAQDYRLALSQRWA